MYHAEITFDKCSEREFTNEGFFTTLQKAVDYLERQGSGQMLATAAINGKKVYVLDGRVYGNDNEPVCTNEEWHAIFAPEHLRIPAVDPLTNAGLAQKVEE